MRSENLTMKHYSHPACELESDGKETQETERWQARWKTNVFDAWEGKRQRCFKDSRSSTLSAINRHGYCCGSESVHGFCVPVTSLLQWFMLARLTGQSKAAPWVPSHSGTDSYANHFSKTRLVIACELGSRHADVGRTYSIHCSGTEMKGRDRNDWNILFRRILQTSPFPDVWVVHLVLDFF